MTKSKNPLAPKRHWNGLPKAKRQVEPPVNLKQMPEAQVVLKAICDNFAQIQQASPGWVCKSESKTVFEGNCTSVHHYFTTPNEIVEVISTVSPRSDRPIQILFRTRNNLVMLGCWLERKLDQTHAWEFNYYDNFENIYNFNRIAQSQLMIFNIVRQCPNLLDTVLARGHGRNKRFNKMKEYFRGQLNE